MSGTGDYLGSPGQLMTPNQMFRRAAELRAQTNPPPDADVLEVASHYEQLGKALMKRDAGLPERPSATVYHLAARGM